MNQGLGEASTQEFRSRRPEYQAINPTKLGQQIRQERRVCKYINHLNKSRMKKESIKELGQQPKESPEQQEFDMMIDDENGDGERPAKIRRY